MKKIISFVVAIILVTGALGLYASAASFSYSLQGPSTVRAGENITITFYASGSSIRAVSGALNYSTGTLSYKSYSALRTGWSIDLDAASGKISFLCADDKLASPVNDGVALFSVTFTVSASAPAGAAINISGSGVYGSDGTRDINASASYSVNVKAPLSSNANLSSLVLSNATLSPAFSASTVYYSVSVGYDVERLAISAKTADPDAKTSVYSPALTAGGTSYASVTVTAPNGNTKMYSITVTRAQDPNYVKSNNSRLSDITIEGFYISPAFSAENKEYVVWLPYEYSSLKVLSGADDEKAVVTVEGNTNLNVGDNEVSVICTAEDGSATVYKINAHRAQKYGLPEPTQPPTEPSEFHMTPIQTLPEPSETQDIAANETNPTDNKAGQGSVKEVLNEKYPLWYALVGLFLFFIIGLLIGYIIDRRKKINKAISKAKEIVATQSHEQKALPPEQENPYDD